MSLSPSDAHNEVEAQLATQLLSMNQELLDAIVKLDVDAYNFFCSDSISCIEPESNGNVVIGKKFHHYYFDVFRDRINEGQAPPLSQTNVTMVQPHVQFLGNRCGENEDGAPTAAVLSYVKLTQQIPPGGAPVTVQQSETRVWEKLEHGQWVCVHFHKSPYKA